MSLVRRFRNLYRLVFFFVFVCFLFLVLCKKGFNFSSISLGNDRISNDMLAMNVFLVVFVTLSPENILQGFVTLVDLYSSSAERVVA